MPRLSAKSKHALNGAGGDFADAPGAEPAPGAGATIKPTLERPAPYIPRGRLPPDASEATRAVLSYLHGPVYALDRKPHLAQHVAIAAGATRTDPAKIASSILAAIMEALDHQIVQWKGAPGVSAWARNTVGPGSSRSERVETDRAPVFASVGPKYWYGHVHLPKTFPERRATVVWDDEGCGLAGRDLCVEFCLTETATGAVTGFSYRFDLSGTPFAVPVIGAEFLPKPASAPAAKPESAAAAAAFPAPPA